MSDILLELTEQLARTAATANRAKHELMSCEELGAHLGARQRNHASLLVRTVIFHLEEARGAAAKSMEAWF